MEEQDNQEQSEEREVEILEFSLTGDEVNELIEKLNALKTTKTSISFDVDEENEFIIHYESAGDVVEKAEEKPEGKVEVETQHANQPDHKTQQQLQNQTQEGKPTEVPTLDGIERQ